MDKRFEKTEKAIYEAFGEVLNNKYYVGIGY